MLGLQAFFFYVFALITVGAAVMVVLARNPVHSVLFLILCFVSSAGLFLLTGAEFLAAIKAGVGLSSGFNIPDLFPTWTAVLAKVTGMKRSLQDIHRTVDSILQEIIDERKAVLDDKAKSGAGNAEENLVDVLIGLQEKGGFGFHLNNSRIKAIILVSMHVVRSIRPSYHLLFGPTC